jgi:hypothetical protein
MENTRLNLAVASRIYLLEPQWNPAIELQAIGRALRLGQKEQVTIVRYIMKNTVEDVRPTFLGFHGYIPISKLTRRHYRVTFCRDRGASLNWLEEASLRREVVYPPKYRNL